MRIIACCLLVLVLTTNLKSQNLCPNPGFEQLSGCPAGPKEITLAQPWVATGDTADLFSFCHVNGTTPGCNDVSAPVNFAGHAPAHGGSSYTGIYTKKSGANQRTYMQAPLASPMVTGQLYKTEAWFRRSSNSKYATNRLGMVFSTSQLSQSGSTYINVTPQVELTTVVADTGSWTALTSYYVAAGGEAFITIGNFRTDAATTAFNFINPSPACAAMNSVAYYYVDDILVTPIVETISVTGDTVICPGQNTALTGITNTHGYWSLLSTPTDTLTSVNNILTVAPTDTTTYLWHGLGSSVPVTVYVVNPPVIALPANSIVCDGTILILDATFAGSTYLWSTGETTAQIAVGDSGTYIVAVNNGGCIARDTFNLTVLSNPEVVLTDAIVCGDNGDIVIADAGPGASYNWYPGGEITQEIAIIDPGVYSVVVTHTDGCTKTDSLVVLESCPETLFIPGAFTPNADGKNDTYYAQGTNVTNFKIIIFNRWGQTMHTTIKLGFDGNWNGKFEGKDAPSGVYSYLITYDAIQSTGRLSKETRAGYFALIR